MERMVDILAGYPLEGPLFLIILLVMGADMVVPKERRRAVGALAVLGLGLLLAASFLVSGEGGGGPDGYALFFQRLFLLSAIFVSVMALECAPQLRRPDGEFQILLLFATGGLLFICRAQDFLTLFVSIELLTISLFILAAYVRDDGRSAEAGMKYVILGALASAFLLYGTAFVYGYTGSLQFHEVARAVQAGTGGPGVLLGLALVMAGLAFKVAAVPFQFWVPDVYEGAPTPVTAFLTVASKGAGFAALLRVLMTMMGPLDEAWSWAVVLLAAATLLYGNLGAIPQTNIKRLLGYSSIGQAGFILIGVAAASGAGVRAILFYLLAYAFAAMGAFLAIIAVSRTTGSDQIGDYGGLWRRSPFLAVAITASFLSLAGFPPLAGFFGKFLLLVALVEKSGMVWLAVLAGANVIISLYYYLGVIRRVIVDETREEAPIPVPLSLKLAIGVALLGTILLGIYQGPFLAQAEAAAKVLL